jgi:hypothetical protein
MVPYHTHLTRSTHNNLLCSHQQSWAWPLLSRKRTPDPIHSTTADRSMGPYPVFLPRQLLKQWRQSQSSIDNRLLGLLGLYLWHVIGMFNTYSRGSTHRSLIDTGDGYNFEGVDFPDHTPQPSQPMILYFLPKCPVRSQVIQSQHKLKWCETPIVDPWSFDHSVSTEAYIYD